jgi:hypothetical protein
LEQQVLFPDLRVLKEIRESQVLLETRASREPRVTKGIRVLRDPQETRASREPRATKGTKV